MTTLDPVSSKPLVPKVDLNNFSGSIILAFLATAGLFYVNIMPALIDSLISGLQFSPQSAGYVGSANTAGAAAGALTMVFLIKHINWRLVAVSLLLIMIGIDIYSTTITDTQLIMIRFIHGLAGGLLVGLAFALITRTKKPEKVFGFLLALQFGFGGLAVMIVPGTVAEYGHQMTFLTLALFSIVTLFLITFLPQIPEKKAAKIDSSSSQHGRALNLLPLILTLGSIVLFQATNMAIGAYLLGLGKSFGLTSEYSSRIVGLSYWIGAMGAVLVSVMGLRFGRFWPLTIAFLITLAGFLLFHYSANKIAFALANFVTAATWAFVIPYLFGLCSELDISGRMAAMAGFCSKVGLTLGPLLGGWLIANNANYSLLINVTFFGLVASMFLIQFALIKYSASQKIKNDQSSP